LYLQLLRLQVKETCKHSSGTQRTFSKAFAFVLRTLFQQKLSLSTPAARVGFAASDKVRTYMFFS
jgi:hypothetical protein